jgi:valyl-tRNA synthetase
VRLNAIGEENAEAAAIDLDTLRSYIIDNQKSLNDFDIWILNGLDELIVNVEKGFMNYSFTNVIEDVVKFTWNNFCDRYIEIAKLQKHDLTDKVMLYIVGTLLKLLHPVAPFVTDALYSDM